MTDLTHILEHPSTAEFIPPYIRAMGLLKMLTPTFAAIVSALTAGVAAGVAAAVSAFVVEMYLARLAMRRRRNRYGSRF